jgi:probable biosynthetic protein (TIGR04099 family)
MMTAGRYRAGMPQLSYTGLSENWLLKECGHRHWEALAAQTGRATHDLGDDDGHRSYAAFTAVRLQAFGLDTLRENDAFEIGSALCRTGGVRHVSTHRVQRGDAPLAHVSMSSTFVTRGGARDNRSVARAALSALPGEVSPVPEEALPMIELGKRLRAGDSGALAGALPPVACAPAEFLPCPNSDFNGADFLYFANFQSFVDRAEWQRHRFVEPPVVASRSLYYYGNVDLGDALTVHVIGEHSGERGIAHWSEVRRSSDGRKIADVMTEKHWRRR